MRTIKNFNLASTWVQLPPVIPPPPLKFMGKGERGMCEMSPIAPKLHFKSMSWKKKGKHTGHGRSPISNQHFSFLQTLFSSPLIASSLPWPSWIKAKNQTKKIASHDFALKTESQTSHLCYNLIMWFQRDRSFLSSKSSNQKTPCSNYILLGVNQHFEKISFQTSVYKVNKDIYLWLSAASSESRCERLWEPQLSPARRGILFWLCWRSSPVGAWGYLGLQSLCVSVLLFINIKIVRWRGWQETLNSPLGKNASSCWVFEP